MAAKAIQAPKAPRKKTTFNTSSNSNAKTNKNMGILVAKAKTAKNLPERVRDHRSNQSR
jgi:hypothetical protein